MNQVCNEEAHSQLKRPVSRKCPHDIQKRQQVTKQSENTKLKADIQKVGYKTEWKHKTDIQKAAGYKTE